MQNSNIMIKTINKIGKNVNNTYFFKVLNIKALKIFNKVCPANIFANNRTDKLNGRIKYETNSITTKNGTSGLGTPLGTNNLKKFSWLLNKLIMVMPTNTEKAIWKVRIMWPVIVKPYGNKPIKLDNSIKEKINKTKGKYFKDKMLLTCCFTSCRTKLYTFSVKKFQRVIK